MAESGSSHRLNDIKGWTIRSSHGDMSCTNEPKSKKPERWSGRTRNREPIATVLLNPEREQQVEKRAA